jgi:CRP-like cAMP-binding protein
MATPAGAMAVTTGWPPHGSFLYQLPQPSLDALLAAGTSSSFPGSHRLIRQGEDSMHVLVLCAGRVKVTLDTVDGHRILIEVRSAGDLVGEMEPLLGEGPRVASVTTIGPVQALVLDGPKFLALLHRHVDLNMTLLRFTTRRLQAMNASRINLSQSVRHRLYRLLDHLVDRYGEPVSGGSQVRIDIELTQSDLASSIGASTSMVERIMSDLRKKGIVTSQYRQITVHQPAALRRLSYPPTSTANLVPRRQRRRI